MVYGTFYDTDAQGGILGIGEYRPVTKAAISKGDQQMDMTTDNEMYEQISKSCRTKADYDAALDNLAKGYASGSGSSFEESYLTIMKSELGQRLYASRELAPAGSAPVAKQDLQDSGGPVYAKIERLSRAHMRDHPGVSFGEAMRQVLEETPNLWLEYSMEAGQGSSPSPLGI